MPYVIQNWMGKICFDGKEFSDFETAWGFLREQIDMWIERDNVPEDKREDEFNDWCGEFYVEQI